VKGAIGAVTAIGSESVFITAQGGQIEVFKLKYGEGKKLPAPQACAEAGLAAGAVLGA
jgi:methionyl-tRNA formyltransferase